MNLRITGVNWCGKNHFKIIQKTNTSLKRNQLKRHSGIYTCDSNEITQMKPSREKRSTLNGFTLATLNISIGSTTLARQLYQTVPQLTFTWRFDFPSLQPGIGKRTSGWQAREFLLRLLSMWQRCKTKNYRSVPYQDVFGPLGSRSGSGSFHQQAKN